MRVDFQIVHNIDSDIKAHLLGILKQTLDESTTIDYTVEKKPNNIEDWSIFNWIEIKYKYKTKKKRFIPRHESLQPTYSSQENLDQNYMFIVGFSLNIEEHIGDIIKEFEDYLNDDENIEVVFKYFDEPMLRKHKNIGEEIFVLEMKLRELLSFIFIDTYKEDYYNLLKEIDIKTQPINRNNRPNEEYFKKHFENEFFFLLFSDYIRIDHLKKIDQSDLIDIIVNSNDYDELKQNIQNRGIIKEKYQDLIASIKQNLEPIENMRNCIAHNRSFTDTILENYQQAKVNLDKVIKEFWEELENES